jgi:uncharacterized membrane protein
MSPTTVRRTDRVLLAEVTLIIVLFALGIALYWRPAAAGLDSDATSWWQWLLLAALFFAIMALETLRRRRKLHRAA